MIEGLNMPIIDRRKTFLESVSLLIGLFIISTAYSCTPNTNTYKRSGDNVTLSFQATTVSPENPELVVANVISSPNGSTLLAVAYRNGNHTFSGPCNGCTFTGKVATGNLSVRIDNLQASAGGTYKHTDGSVANVRRCVTVYILGVPTKPDITANKDLSVGESVTFTCSSMSTTTPSNHGLNLTYTWTVDNVVNPDASRYSYSTNRETLTLSSVVKEDDKNNFTCTATENVNEGYTSTTSDSITLNVSHPPDGPPGIHGYNDGDTYKILENQQGLLSCFSNGDSPTVVSFYVEGKEGQTDVITGEHDDVQFTCVVDSKPDSYIRLMFGSDVLKDVSNAKSLSYNRSNMACLHDGAYTCEGSNGYGQPSNRTIQLFVRCTGNSKQQTDNTSLIVGVTLGLFSFVVVVYASVVTVLLKRKTAKGIRETMSKPSNVSTTHTTYMNVGYKSDVTEDQEKTSSGSTGNPGNADADKQYTDLMPHTRDDHSAYETL